MSCEQTHLGVMVPVDYSMPDGSPKHLDRLQHRLGREPHDEPNPHPDPMHLDWHWQEIQQSVLSNCNMVHMCRFQIVDHFVPSMGDSAPDRLEYKYLLFIAEIDGTADEFYDHLYKFNANLDYQFIGDGGFVESIWGNCIDYPQQRGAVFFRRFMRRHEFEPSITFASAPGHCVHEILDALAVQRFWAELIGQYLPYLSGLGVAATQGPRQPIGPPLGPDGMPMPTDPNIPGVDPSGSGVPLPEVDPAKDPKLHLAPSPTGQIWDALTLFRRGYANLTPEMKRTLYLLMTREIRWADFPPNELGIDGPLKAMLIEVFQIQGWNFTLPIQPPPTPDPPPPLHD